MGGCVHEWLDLILTVYVSVLYICYLVFMLLGWRAPVMDGKFKWNENSSITSFDIDL